MSTGGIFQLISNTGQQDALIMDTENLKETIKKLSFKKIDSLKKKNPNLTYKDLIRKAKDWMPDLKEIEKTHVFFINSTFKPFVAIAHEYSRTPPRQGIPRLGSIFSFTLPIFGQFVNDLSLYVKISGLSAVNAANKVRYAEFVGHRLCKNVKFKVQNQCFDEYTSDDQSCHYQFKVPQHKEIGYKRNVGQEVGIDGHITFNPITDEVRHYRTYGTGPQTFKHTQVDLEMWIPILFWFKDIQCSLPNFLLPLNQTDIEIEFERENNLVSLGDNAGSGDGYNIPVVEKCFLYVNHLFLLPEVQRIFQSKFACQLIRVHRKHVEQLTQSSRNVHLHQIKWPVECLYVAVRPKVNLTFSNLWHKMSHLRRVEVDEAVVANAGPPPVIATNKGIFYEPYHTVKCLSLTAHDTVIYPILEPSFYNNYIPSRYGELYKTPSDIGWYMMNFNMYPGKYQPSGHFNTSKSRELYLYYETAQDPDTGLDIIRSNNPCELVVIADCINFVLYEDNNMTLRFST